MIKINFDLSKGFYIVNDALYMPKTQEEWMVIGRAEVFVEKMNSSMKKVVSEIEEIEEAKKKEFKERKTKAEYYVGLVWEANQKYLNHGKDKKFLPSLKEITKMMEENGVSLAESARFASINKSYCFEMNP